MKILFCSPNPLTKEQGAAKVLVELAEEMSLQGWKCDLVGPGDLGAGDLSGHPNRRYAAGLRSFLRERASDYDVVDYDHATLPFSRQDFNESTLFVARSVLLAQHLKTIRIPFIAMSWKSHFGRVLKAPKASAHKQWFVGMADKTVREADLVNVSNNEDRDELLRRGVAAEKILVLPFGLSRKRLAMFDAISTAPPARPRVAFIGTFEPRKGAREFPLIVETITAAIPDVEFRLLGTGQFYPTKWISSQFSTSLRSRVEIIPFFDSMQLPDLLQDCSIGIFPSHMEGFGFGVLEMLAAAVPVVAYNAPGPPMMLPPEYLVPRGDGMALSEKVIELLRDPERLHKARQWAHERAKDFQWCDIAENTIAAYQKAADHHKLIVSAE